VAAAQQQQLAFEVRNFIEMSRNLVLDIFSRHSNQEVNLNSMQTEDFNAAKDTEPHTRFSHFAINSEKELSKRSQKRTRRK
jgi:hypothetical protein